MHAMGPNVAGVIGSAVAAGYFLVMFGGAVYTASPGTCRFRPEVLFNTIQ